VIREQKAQCMTSVTTQPQILTQTLTSPMAWDATSAVDNEVTVTLGPACLGELDTIAQDLIANPLPTLLVNAEHFAVDHCQKVCRDIREKLDHGTGFVIVEQLPVGRYEHDIVVKLYWLLMSLVGRPVAQKWNGEMIYDVTDTGKKATAGSGIRSSKTNGGQFYHTDNSFNLPPHYVGLLCLRPAVEGGESGLISFDSVHNKLLEKYPEVLPRLYQPFYFDRQREHADDEQLYSFRPVFDVNNNVLHTRLSSNLIRQGYVVAGEEMDDETVRTLAALDDVMESPELGKIDGSVTGARRLPTTRIRPKSATWCASGCVTTASVFTKANFCCNSGTKTTCFSRLKAIGSLI